MTRTALLLPLALLGLSSSALAFESDELDPSILPDSTSMELDEEAFEARHRTTRTATRSRGGGSVTKTTARNGRGQTMQRVTQTHGNKSRTTVRGRSVKSQSYGTNMPNGHTRTTNTTKKTRSRTTESNGHKTRSYGHGKNETRSVTTGRVNGKKVHEQHGTRNERVATKVHDGKGPSTRVKSQQRTTRDRLTIDGNTVRDRTKQTTTRPLARGGHPRPSTVRPGSATRPGAAAQRAPSGRPGGTAARPSTSVRTTHVRPSTRTTTRTTTHVRPSTRWYRPSTRVVHARPATRVVSYTHVRPYHGVFVYGPRPTTHVHYQESGEVVRRHLPERQIDRDKSLALGLKTGSLTSGYYDGGSYSDLGLGIAGRYRPAESVGLQLDLLHHAQSYSINTERAQTMAAGSVQLFAFPWTRVSPYVSTGVTYNARNLNDAIGSDGTSATVIAQDSLWGLHGGLGLELALGQRVALDIEGRYIGYLDKGPSDPSSPGALQLTGGVMVHF